MKTYENSGCMEHLYGNTTVLQCKTPEKSKSGFTLIELLVVIAIIAILARNLVPRFRARQRKRAPRFVPEQPQANRAGVRAIHTGLRRENAKMIDGTQGAWANILQPYVKSWQLFHCPSGTSGNGGDNITDYSYNYYLGYDSSIGYIGRSISALTNSSLTVLAFDSLQVYGNAAYDNGCGSTFAYLCRTSDYTPGLATFQSASAAQQRHLEASKLCLHRWSCEVVQRTAWW